MTGGSRFCRRCRKTCLPESGRVMGSAPRQGNRCLTARHTFVIGVLTASCRSGWHVSEAPRQLSGMPSECDRIVSILMTNLSVILFGMVLAVSKVKASEEGAPGK